jgi:hypothetical protein
MSWLADHVTPLYQQRLALTWPTSGGRSVGIVRSRTKVAELAFICAGLNPRRWNAFQILRSFNYDSAIAFLSSFPLCKKEYGPRRQSNATYSPGAKQRPQNLHMTAVNE